ncbi:hypothetical protein N8Z07_01065 [Pelagibacteraceae bacterium]|nr:hypothetical protein [Pelagibacteraceae bacterium]
MPNLFLGGLLATMSAEKITSNEQNLVPSATPKFKEKMFSGRVDINDLLARVRKEEHNKNKTNLIFISLFASLILITLIILSF